MPSGLKVGIIGGTGLDDPDIIENRREISATSGGYGNPSDVFICGVIAGVDCVILARHGRKHHLDPTRVNYRANILALKEAGCTHILATTACGSLKEELAPGHFVVLDQFIDRTTKRDMTFYDQAPNHMPGVCHIALGDPFCNELRKVLVDACKNCSVTVHPSGTVVTIEGPRFSSRAESNVFRSWNADVINMTTVPEVVLAKEMGLMYASLAMVTDYDCWRIGEESVSTDAVMAAVKKNSSQAKQVLVEAIKLIAKLNWDEVREKLLQSCRNSVF